MLGNFCAATKTIPNMASVHTQNGWGGLMSVTERSYGLASISKAESLVGGGRGGGIYGIFNNYSSSPNGPWPNGLLTQRS